MFHVKQYYLFNKVIQDNVSRETLKPNILLKKRETSYF